MESIDQKDLINSEEPIKAEVSTNSQDSNERPNNAASPPPNCSICLGKLVNKSFTDSCLHQFCFTCLLQWSKIKTECPLCKQVFKSIIHNVRAEGDYDEYNVPITHVAATLDVTADIHFLGGGWDIDVIAPRPFMYRTTMGASRRYGLVNPESVARREQLPSISGRPEISNEERRRRRNDPLAFRRNLYRQGTWSDPLTLRDAFGRYRECYPEYYRLNPMEVNRLIPWLNREIQALLTENAAPIAYVMNIILEYIKQYNIKSSAFRDVVRPFFGVHTNQFIHEFYNFARTNYDLYGYDQNVGYLQRNALSHDYSMNVVSPSSSSSSSSDDSDVRIIDEFVQSARTNPRTIPRATSVLVSFAGSSTVNPFLNRNQPSMPPDVFTISSSSSSEDECEVIGYVKPRHERTPEIINLSSSDIENLENPQPSTSQSNETIALEEAFKQEEEILPSTSLEVSNRRCRSKAEVAKAQIYEIFNSPTDSEFDSDYSYSIKKKTPSRSRKNSKKSSKACVRKSKRKTSTRNKRKMRSSSQSEDSEPQKLTKKRSINKYTQKKSSVDDRSSDESVHTNEKKKSGRAKGKSIVSCAKSCRTRSKNSKRFKRNTSSSSDSLSDSSDVESKSTRNYRKSTLIVYYARNSHDKTKKLSKKRLVENTQNSSSNNQYLDSELNSSDNSSHQIDSSRLLKESDNAQDNVYSETVRFSESCQSSGTSQTFKSDVSSLDGHSSSKTSSSSSSSSGEKYRSHKKYKVSDRRCSRS